MIQYICEQCGGANVTSDAVATWDVRAQRWVIVGHYNSSECLDCKEETNLIEQEMAPSTI